MNSLFIIFPYKYEGCWVFDDPAVGLSREPFVLGIDAMLDRLTANISGADNGVKIVFSPMKFPGFSVELHWRREETGGNWYYCPQYDMEGWLCPALFKYFDAAPNTIYVRAEQKQATADRARTISFPVNLEQLLPQACAWVDEMERPILENGTPLPARQMEDARIVGVTSPEKVRLLAVDHIPVPKDPTLAQAGALMGLISPMTAGMTLHYGIFIRNDCWGDRALVAHELMHVHQYERLGSIEAFLRQYLMECANEGYPNGAMEQEAVAGAVKVMGRQ